MERLTDSELEELVLGIDIEPPGQEESIFPSLDPSLEQPISKKNSLFSKISSLLFVTLLALSLGIIIGMVVSNLHLRRQLTHVSSQMEQLLNTWQQYEDPTFSSQEVIEPLQTTAPFDRAA